MLNHLELDPREQTSKKFSWSYNYSLWRFWSNRLQHSAILTGVEPNKLKILTKFDRVFTIDGKVCYFSTIDGRCVWLAIMIRWLIYESDFAHLLQWRHNERNGVSNHQRLDCLLNILFKRRTKKTSKLCVTGLCSRNSPVAGEFLSQRPSNAENASIWWRHHVLAQSVGPWARN